MNIRKQWCYTCNDLPDNDRNVLVYTTKYPDIMIGFYLKNDAKWHVCDEEVDNNLEIDCWMDLPKIPRIINEENLVFRNANEARYITSEATKRLSEEREELNDFFTIRSAIVNAASRGEMSCQLDIKNVSNKIVKKLEDAGYDVKLNGDSYFISW